MTYLRYAVFYLVTRPRGHQRWDYLKSEISQKIWVILTKLCYVATTIEITTTIEIIISIVVESAFQTKHHIATTIEITTTIEIIISIVVENEFQT